MGRAVEQGREIRRRSPALLIAAATVLLLPAICSPTAFASERNVAARADAGDMIVSPKPDAFIKRAQARIAFRAPAGTNRLWVRLNDRNITSRFGRNGGQRVATLSVGSGLRYGINTLSVLAKRGDRKPRADARSFTFGRRTPGLARLKLKPGPVTSVGIRAAAPPLTPAVFDSRRQFKQRLNVIRRNRLIRIGLNGRSVTKAFDSPRPTLWKTRLSATHGLHHGVNRLRALVAEPETGRYEELGRRFIVPENVPLPAAGRDLSRPFGLDRMPLDASDSQSGDGGQLSYRWRILSKPRGSDPELRRADSARPLLDPDRRGRYRLGLQVTDPTDPRASSSSVDLMDADVGPSQMLLRFGYVPTGGVGTQGVKVGDKAYGSTCGLGIQWLTLDRVTLKPSKTGNALIDPHGSCGGARGPVVDLDTVAKALAKGGHGDLVILTHSPRFEAPLKPGQADQFNSILKLIGVGPLEKDSLTRPFQQLVVVGVPYGGDGSGYSSQVFNPPDDRLPGQPALTGWLMPDSVQAAPRTPRFRFQPEKIEFDTSVEDARGFDSGMQLGSEFLGGSIDRPHASGGFHVVAIDPITFKPVNAQRDNRVFNTGIDDTDQSARALSERRGMVQYLNELAKREVLVAVQSIGRVRAATPAPPSEQRKQELDDAWKDMSKAMQALGANPHTFFTLGCDLSDYHRPVCNFPDPSQAPAGGSYAFLGGSKLKRSEMVESSSSVVIDPSLEVPLTEGGSLQGFASIRSDGLMKPAVADGSDRLQFEVYDFAFRDATPWPETKEAGAPESDKYRAALAYISTCLPQFEGWGPDLRSAYAGNLNLDYIAAKDDLAKLPYPTPSVNPQVCEDPQGKPKWDFKQDPGFERRHYLGMAAELSVEFGWLDSVQRLFDAAEKALGRSGAEEFVDLKTLGDNIKNTIKPPSAAAKIGIDIGEFFLLIFEDLALIPESTVTLGFVEAAAAIYQISTSIASDAPGGKPLSDQIDEKVDDVAGEAAHRLTASAAGLDRLRQVINSDIGRLQALGSVAGTPAYTIDTSTMTDSMTQAANQWFSSELMPVAFGVHALSRADTPEGKSCYITIPAGYNFSKAAPSGWFDFFGDFNIDRFRARYPSPFVLALHDLHDGPEFVPSEDLANSIFRADAQGGFGVQIARFVWEQYEDARRGAAPANRPPPTNIAQC